MIKQDSVREIRRAERSGKNLWMTVRANMSELSRHSDRKKEKKGKDSKKKQQSRGGETKRKKRKIRENVQSLMDDAAKSCSHTVLYPVLTIVDFCRRNFLFFTSWKQAVNYVHLIRHVQCENIIVYIFCIFSKESLSDPNSDYNTNSQVWLSGHHSAVAKVCSVVTKSLLYNC